MVQQSSKANGEQQRFPGFLNLAAQPVQAKRAQPCQGMGILTSHWLQTVEDPKRIRTKMFSPHLNLGRIIELTGPKGFPGLKDK